MNHANKNMIEFNNIIKQGYQKLQKTHHAQADKEKWVITHSMYQQLKFFKVLIDKNLIQFKHSNKSLIKLTAY